MADKNEGLKVGLAAALGAAVGTVSSKLADANGDGLKELVSSAKEKVSALIGIPEANAAEVTNHAVAGDGVSHVDSVDFHLGKAGLDVTVNATDAHGHVTKLLFELGGMPDGGVDVSSMVVDVADHLGGETAQEATHGIVSHLIDHITGS